jgi:hypothetical protein
MKNPQVFFLSIIALLFVALGIFVHWTFLLASVIIMMINQKKLFKNKN